MVICNARLLLFSILTMRNILSCVCFTRNNYAWNFVEEVNSWFYYGADTTQAKRMSRAILNPTEDISTDTESQILSQSSIKGVTSITKEFYTNVWDSKLCANDSDQPPSSFLWRISTEPPSYLFGTLHVAYVHVWPQVASIVKETFRKADHVYFELDLTNPHTLEELRNCQMLPGKTRLTDLLPVKLIERVHAHLVRFRQLLELWNRHERLGYTHVLYETIIKDWRRKRPIWILLLVNSLNRGELSDRGVPVLDLYLAQEARRLGKKRGAVEKVEDQCRPLNEVKNDQVAMALEMTLDSLESTTQSAQGKQREADRPQSPPSSQLQSQRSASTPPVSDRENSAIETRRFSDSLAGSSHQNQPATRGRTNIQTNGARHTEWFMHPVQQLVHQYNCGDLTPVLQGASISKAASVTASNSVVDKQNSGAHNSSRTSNNWSKAMTRTNIGVAPDSIPLMLELEIYLNRELIVKRNARMARQIIETLKMVETRNESVFFALGAAHFLGEPDTIIDHLKRAGYEITPIPRGYAQVGLNRKTETEIKMHQQQSEKYIFRNRRKHTEDKELLSDADVPEFRPRYVKFENNWIRIEDFKPNTYPNRKQQTSAHAEIPKLQNSVENFSGFGMKLPNGSEPRKPLTQKLLQDVSKSVSLTIGTSSVLSIPIYMFTMVSLRLFPYFF